MSDDSPAPPKTNGRLTIPMPFEAAIQAALETPPEPEKSKPFGKRTGPRNKEKVRSTKK